MASWSQGRLSAAKLKPEIMCAVCRGGALSRAQPAGPWTCAGHGRMGPAGSAESERAGASLNRTGTCHLSRKAHSHLRPIRRAFRSQTGGGKRNQESSADPSALGHSGTPCQNHPSRRQRQGRSKRIDLLSNHTFGACVGPAQRSFHRPRRDREENPRRRYRDPSLGQEAQTRRAGPAKPFGIAPRRRRDPPHRELS